LELGGRGTQRDIDASTTLAAEPGSAAEARRFTVDVLRSWGAADLIDTATLLVSELVTNAVLHARSSSELALRRIGGRLRVEITDASAVGPTRRSYPPDAGTGRGMMLVEALAVRWGSERDGDGKRVWFELELPMAAEVT
jgi:anti-sigma regulatory factor (Ser/Thr protein kinase)